jgi:hypothetical protein
MNSIRLVNPGFREGDEVVLADGTYQGTPGVFLRLKEDTNWADITECNGRIRSHPVVWLVHSRTVAIRDRAN